MTAEQTAVNHRALMAAAAKLERTGYDGDPFRFVESLVVSVLADGYRPVEKPPAPRGPGARRQSIDAAIEAARLAVRAAKDARKKPATPEGAPAT